MSESLKNTRRSFIKQVALGSTLGTTAFGQTQTSSPSGRRSSPEDLHTEVLVVGGGMAGVGAALAAARQGSKTLLIEDCGFFGGVASWGVGMQINQMRPRGVKRSVIHEMLNEKLLSMGKHAAIFGIRSPGNGSHALIVNTNYLKVAFLDLLDEVGCRYLVHTRAVDTLLEGQRVTGVVIATKRGLVNIKADVIVDCTGDADVSYYAGAETMIATGRISPQTLCFNTGNVTKEQIKAGRAHFMEHNQEKAKKAFPLIQRRMPGIGQVAEGGFYYSNHPGTRDQGKFDITDPEQFTQAECISRRQIVQTVESWRQFGGEHLKDIDLVGAGARIGVRESRRVKGGYIITEEDAMAGRKFDDAIAWRSGNLDIGGIRCVKMKIHDVPYRALVPDKVDGLLVAGRCISATHEGASAGKSMGNCMATGHAAGMAASMAVCQGKQPRELDVQEMRDQLRKDKVDFDFSGQSQDWIERS